MFLCFQVTETLLGNAFFNTRSHCVLDLMFPHTGGRVREHSGWSEWGHLAMGGEMVEGQHTLPIDLAKEHGWPYSQVFGR